MNNLKHKQIGQDVQLVDSVQKTQQLYREKGVTINIHEVDQILDSMVNIAAKQNKTMNILRVYVVNGEKRSTWKDLDDFLAYYQGLVKETDKFTEFMQVDITYAISN